MTGLQIGECRPTVITMRANRDRWHLDNKFKDRLAKVWSTNLI